jgi:hypothetical protein
MKRPNKEVNAHILSTIQKDGSATYTSIMKGLSAKGVKARPRDVRYSLEFLLAKKGIARSKQHRKRYVSTGLMTPWGKPMSDITKNLIMTARMNGSLDKFEREAISHLEAQEIKDKDLEFVDAEESSEIVDVKHTYQPISGRDYVFVGVLAMSVAAITTTLLELL